MLYETVYIAVWFLMIIAYTELHLCVSISTEWWNGGEVAASLPRWVLYKHRRTQDFTVGGGSRCGAHWGPGAKPRFWGLGDKVPQKLKQNVNLVYNF